MGPKLFGLDGQTRPLTADVDGRSLVRIDPTKRVKSRMNLLRCLDLPTSRFAQTTSVRVAQSTFQKCLWGGLLTVFSVGSAWAEGAFVPSSITKGVLLVASPSLNDPNFHHTVLLLVKHGSEGTLGLVLNRPTNVLLSKVLPNLRALNGTDHRLFVGGPVEATRLLLLFRLKEPSADARPVIDGLYVGSTPGLLERVLTEAKPTEDFRAFAGYAGWAPGQLEFEMLQGSWAVLPLKGVDIFSKDQASLWPDSITRLQTPRVISH